MAKLYSLALLAACGAASAQTPALNPMPDGSRDLYLGLGAVSAPRYEGARERRVAPLPVLQFEWSNGFYISGMSAGMHLSNAALSGGASLEYGPLLALQPRRNESGVADVLGGVDNAGGPSVVAQSPAVAPRAAPGNSRLDGMDPIGARLQLGGFFNYYLSPQLRITNSLLYGSGNERHGATWRVGVQRIAAALAPYHSAALSAGVTVANREYNQAFFGVSPAESQRSGFGAYRAGGGLEDAYLGLRWNWALAPSWLVTSNLQATRLLGSARRSPLVEQPANLTVSTALAYRF
jgi:outer membrane protein